MTFFCLSAQALKTRLTSMSRAPRATTGVKEHYGGLREAMAHASSNDFDARSTSVRRVCAQIEEIRAVLGSHTSDGKTTGSVIEELFPAANDDLAGIRATLEVLREKEDSLEDLYQKFIDNIRSPHAD